MRLLLIRHGETVDNIAKLYAGTRDSVLTSHGVLQAQRLGSHLQKNGVHISHIFASDLQRAYKTAEAVRVAQSHGETLEAKKLKLLREQDFGIYEGKPFGAGPRQIENSKVKIDDRTTSNNPQDGDVESEESLAQRLDEFLEEHLWKLVHDESQDEHVVAVVSHGITLSNLWRRILLKMTPAKITSAPGAFSVESSSTIERIGPWSNTGYLDLDLRLANTNKGIGNSNSVQETRREKASESCRANERGTIHIIAVNSVVHLQGLKRTRGGVGSAAYDKGQKKLESFFVKKPKPNPK